MQVDAMAGPQKLRGSLFRFAVSLLIVCIGMLMLLPFFWMISAAFKMQKDVMTIPIQWIPKYFYLNNFRRVLHLGKTATKDYHFLLAYGNSIKVAVFATFCSITTSALAGYGFAKLKFRGSNVLFIVYLAQLMVPAQLTLIPRFVLFSQLGLTSTHWPIILPSILSVSSTFLIRQAFLSVSNDLRNSAMIDGAGEYRIWFRIMLPIIMPTVAALATVQFLDSWNSYLDPLVFLSNWRLLTLPIALDQFVGEEITQYNLVMAACCLTVLPVFFVFLAGQRFFVKGLMVGSVKG
jgi:multiple sugar transport system permease protein